VTGRDELPRLPSMTVRGIGAEMSGSASGSGARAGRGFTGATVAAEAVAATPQTFSPHQAQIVDQPIVRAPQLAHWPGGARCRIRMAMGPRIAPSTAHQTRFRRRRTARYAVAAPNPTSQANRPSNKASIWGPSRSGTVTLLGTARSGARWLERVRHVAISRPAEHPARRHRRTTRHDVWRARNTSAVNCETTPRNHACKPFVPP
jgi:hypothetical protein